MVRYWRSYAPVAVSVCVGLLWFVTFLYVSPQNVVAWLGIENAYLFLSALAFMSGVSIFGGIPYHLVLLTFAAADLDPWLLGLSAAFGVMVGDSTSYLLGYYGRLIVPHWADAYLRTWSGFLEQHRKLVPLFFFLYGCLAPFSNDLVGIFAGLTRHSFVRVIVPLGLGNLVFNTALAFGGAELYALLQSLV